MMNQSRFRLYLLILLVISFVFTILNFQFIAEILKVFDLREGSSKNDRIDSKDNKYSAHVRPGKGHDGSELQDTELKSEIEKSNSIHDKNNHDNDHHDQFTPSPVSMPQDNLALITLSPTTLDVSASNPSLQGSDGKKTDDDNKFLESIKDQCTPSQIRTDLYNCHVKVFLLGVLKAGTSALRKRFIQHPQLRGYDMEHIDYVLDLSAILPGQHVYDERTSFTKDELQKGVGYFLASPAYFTGALTPVDGLTCNNWMCNRTSTKVTKYQYNSFDTTANEPFEYDEEKLLKITVLNIKKRVGPQTKFIVTFREPIARAYSQYWHLSKPCTCVKNRKTGEMKVATKEEIANPPPNTKISGCMSPACFHHYISEAVNNANECITKRGYHPFCARSPLDISSRSKRVLQTSMYSFFLRLWLSEFPKENFCFTTLEYFKGDNATRASNDLAKCLGLDSFPVEALGPVSDNAAITRKTGTKIVQPMLPETKELLQKFFAPINKDLCDLVGGHVCDFPWVKDPTTHAP